MRITAHAIIAATLVVVAAAIAIPVLLALQAEHAIPLEGLTVPAERARPPLATADRALGPLVQPFAGMPMGNPFALRERGRTAMTTIPEPPPPQLQLPEPPLTPFDPASPPAPR
jgi:hypothetical protein